MGALDVRIRTGVVTVVITVLTITLCGCGHQIVTSSDSQTDKYTLQTDGGRALWGLWEIIFTPEGEVQVLDARVNGIHFNVVEFLLPPYCTDCLVIKITEIALGENRIEADVTLKNNQPVTGFDVRGTLISNNGHDLYNADDYTGIWDDGGDVTINPFKRYPADPGPYIFANGTKETNHYSVKLPVPAQLASIMMAVDASWPGECKEPFRLGMNGKGIFGQLCENGGEINCFIDAFTHMSPIASVILNLSPLGGGDVALEPWTDVPGVYNSWAAFGIPFSGADPGEYELWVRAKTGASGFWLYDKFQVQIGPDGYFIPKPVVINVVDYPFANSAVAVKEGNLYALGADGLKVYSLGPDGAPSLIGEAGAPPQDTNRYHIFLNDNIAYGFYERWETLQSKVAIYDISDPSNPQMRGVKENLPVIGGGSATGDYLLVSVPGLKSISYIDATDPDNPKIGTGITLSYAPYGVARDGNLLFTALDGRGLSIFDVTDPTTPKQKGTYFLANVALKPVAAANQTGYFWSKDAELVIFTYVNPDFPMPKSKVKLDPHWGADQFTGFRIDGDFLFGWGETVSVMDVSDIENPTVAYVPEITILTPHTSQGLAFNGHFSYAPNDMELEIIRG